MATSQPSPSSRGTEAEQENEEEEEEEAEEEEEEWCGEYDSTWEDDDDDDEEEEEEGGQLEEDPGRKNSEAANPPAETEEAKPLEKSWSPCPKRASGFQIFNRLLFQNITKVLTSFMDQRSFSLFGTCKSASRQNWMAARDMQKYRHHYPGLEETEMSEGEMWNLSFYKNEICFLPHGLYIEDLLKTWQNDYGTLEENHSYIQWLFPLREQGMNFRARVLTCQEIEAFRNTKQVMERFVQAYKLMLRFYGISLINEETGELSRAENWRERFDNLNWYSHNNLRLTRILKCLGEMGYEHYQVHLVKFFLTETLVNQELPRVLRSTLDYFMFTVRNKRKRRELVHFAWQHFRPRRDFVWGPHKKLRTFKPRSPEFLNDQQLQRDPEPGQKGAGEAVGKDTAEMQHLTDGVSQRLGEEPGQKGAGEAVGKDTAEMQHLTDGVTNHDPVEQPVSTTSSETAVSRSDSAPDTVDKKELSVSREGDGLQARGATASQTGLVSECKPSEKAEQPSPTSVGEAKAEDGVQKGTPDPLPQLEKEDPVGECGSGIDSESLKESKKRKLEMSRIRGESAGIPKGPSDIEKISLNLEEVVIDQKLLDSHLSTEEKANPEGLAGGSEDHGDEKEPDAADAVVKRRKVEETPEGERACETPEKVGVEVAAPEGQIANCVIPTLGQVGQGGAEMLPDASVHTVTKCASASVDPPVNPTSSSEPEQPLGSGAPDKTEGQQTACAVGSVGPPPRGALPADEKAVERPGEGEAGIVEEKTEAAAVGPEAPEAEANQDSQVQSKEGE